MALKIRLARRGAKKRPFYHIVAADVRSPRDGKYLEKLGTYNPLLDDKSARVNLVEDRIKHWLSNGAQPTERVAKFLGAAGIIAMPKITEKPNKSKPKAKAVMMAEEKAEKLKAATEAAEEAKAAAKAEAEAPAPAEEPAAEAQAPAEEAKAEEAAPEAPVEEAPKEEKAEG